MQLYLRLGYLKGHKHLLEYRAIFALNAEEGFCHGPFAIS